MPSNTLLLEDGSMLLLEDGSGPSCPEPVPTSQDTDSPAKIIRKLIVDLGLATMPTQTPDADLWPAYYGKEPPKPDNCITVRTTDGGDYARVMVDGQILGPFGFQVRIRAKDEQTGWKKANDIQKGFAFNVLRRTVYIGPTDNRRVYLIHAVSKIGDVLPIGADTPTSQRFIHTLNAVVNIRQLS